MLIGLLLPELLLHHILLLRHPLLHGLPLRHGGGLCLFGRLGLFICPGGFAVPARSVARPLEARKQPQPQLSLAHIQARAVCHVQRLTAAFERLAVHADGLAAHGLHTQPLVLVKPEPQMPPRHALDRHAQVVGAQRAQRALAGQGQRLPPLERLASLDDHHLAHKARVRQQLQAFFGLTPVAPVPAKAAPDDDRHQQQKPVPCRLSNQLVNLGRHSKVARKRDAA